MRWFVLLEICFSVNHHNIIILLVTHDDSIWYKRHEIHWNFCLCFFFLHCFVVSLQFTFGSFALHTIIFRKRRQTKRETKNATLKTEMAIHIQSKNGINQCLCAFVTLFALETHQCKSRKYKKKLLYFNMLGHGPAFYHDKSLLNLFSLLFYHAHHI